MPEREEHMPGLVPERDGYIPGVPCAVDTSQPDPEAALDFYLQRDNPDLRKQMAAADAPQGFENVVGSINPIPDDQPDTPPHWSVTFAVDDADATAAKAAERGGQVVVPPFDAPWVRMTVIADPQGATFIASKFVPENKDLGSQADAAAASG